MRRVLTLTPCVANLIACVVFLMTRQPMTALLEERDAAQQSGSVIVSSADPLMVIAERPLRQWNWHGRESRWVQVVEVLNWLPLSATKSLGDRWSQFTRRRGIGSLRGDSWVMAWTYLVLSSAQWLLIGVLLGRLVRRGRTREIGTSERSTHAPSARLQKDVNR